MLINFLNYPNGNSVDLSSYTDSKDVTYLGAHLGENSVIETLESSFVTYKVDVMRRGLPDFNYLLSETEHSERNIEELK